MKSSFIRLARAAMVGLAVALAVSCAGGPASTAKGPTVPEKVRKERQVPVQVAVLVKETSFYADGLVDEYSVSKYDQAFKLLAEKAVFDASRPDPIERLVPEYAAGRQSAETLYDADGKVKLRREFDLDKDGRVLAERLLDPKGQLQSSSTYAYDASGNRLEWKAMDAKGLVKALTSYVYDKARLVRIDMKDAAGRATGSIVFEYGADGLLAKKSFLGPDGALQKYEATINKDGRVETLEFRRADGSLAAKSVFSYGPLGQVLSLSEYDGAGALKGRRAYEYAIREDLKTEVYYE